MTPDEIAEAQATGAGLEADDPIPMIRIAITAAAFAIAEFRSAASPPSLDTRANA